MYQEATIVLVSGAFQTTEFYEPLKSALEALGYPVILPTLPTCSDIDRLELGTKDVPDDARVVQAKVEALVSQSKRVVVLMHSYGGQVGTSLKIKDLTVAARREKGLEGGVEYFLWYGSAALPENMSFRQVSGGTIPDYDQCMDDGTYNFLIAGDTFLNELSQESREEWTAKLIPHSQKVFDYSCSDAAWKYVPSIILLTEKDLAIPANYQEMTAQTVNAKKVVRLDMGHGAHLAQTDALARAIADTLHSMGA
ncbi:MAG: hypothetical protein M1822_004800 [Bathelium mastoideum]|nr:MAG: hypothetical protein M1822_004800 [Bathelium mastoideum]